MDLEHVSVEKGKFYGEYYPPELNKSTSSWKNATQSVLDPRVSSPEIDRVLGKLSERGLFGKAYVNEYLHELHRRNCRLSTIRGNGCAILLFFSFLKDIGKDQLEIITRKEISAFVEHEQDRGLSPNTVSTRLRALYAFLNYLIEHEVLHPDLLKRKLRIKIPDALPRAIDPEDIKQLLAVVNKPRDRALTLTLLRTGMRIGELLNTKLEDLNLTDQCIEIFEAQKNRVGRVVYLSNDAQAALRKWLKIRNRQTDYLFYGYGGRPLSYEAARSIFRKCLDKAGLSHKEYTLHCLRHTYASELLNAGMQLQCLQELLGHSCIEMTRRYARLTDNTRREQYYKAMAIIERGEMNGHYRLHPELP